MRAESTITPKKRLIPGWCGFWLTAPLLVISVVIEGIHGVIAAIHFLFTRKRQRERFRAMLIGRGGRLAAALLVMVTPLVLQVGCTSFPGSSFDDQMDQLSWSAEALASGDGKIEDVLLDFYSMCIGDLSTDELEDTFEQLGW